MEGSTMSALITDLSTVITAIFGWVVEIADTITGSPLMLITTAFLILGGSVGIFGRLLSRS